MTESTTTKEPTSRTRRRYFAPRSRTHILSEPPQRTFAAIEQPLPESMLGSLGIPSEKHGIRTQEQNKDLSPYKARGFLEDPGVFDEMLRTDGTVAGTLALVSREISRARWVVEAPPKPTRKEAEAVELVNRFFGLDGREAWLYGGLPYHLRHAVKSLAYGFAPFEVTWESKAWTRARIMAPSQVRWRAPQSVVGWAWNGDDLAGLIQTTKNTKSGGGYQGLLARLLGEQNTVTIPVRQLLLYTYDETEGCPEGVSIYRPAWIWWRAKRDLLNRHQQVGELVQNGVVKFKRRYDAELRTSQAISQEDWESLNDIYSGFEGGGGWMEEPEGWEIDQEFPNIQAASPEKMLMYCDNQIRTVFLAQLLGVGSDGTASLSSSLGQLLYNSIDAVAGGIAEVLNGQPGRPWTGLVKPLIDANISHDASFRYPRLTARGLENQDTKAWVDSVVKAMQFGAMWYTSGVEEEMRHALDMPALTQEERDARDKWAQERFEVGDLLTQPAAPGGASGDGGERASEGASQGETVTAPQQESVVDPDGMV